MEAKFKSFITGCLGMTLIFLGLFIFADAHAKSTGKIEDLIMILGGVTLLAIGSYIFLSGSTTWPKKPIEQTKQL